MEENQNPCWQRLSAVIEWADMTANYFARHIGLPRGENIYQIKRGNNGISRRLAERIVTHFPQISKMWLLTGEGEMFVEPQSVACTIPFYNFEIEEWIHRLDELTPTTEMAVPQLSDCDLAMVYHGKPMEKVFPAGSTLFLKKKTVEAIIPGREYVVITKKIVTLRNVRLAKKADELRLSPADHLNYDDMVVPIDQILAVYEVCGQLTINR